MPNNASLLQEFTALLKKAFPGGQGDFHRYTVGNHAICWRDLAADKAEIEWHTKVDGRAEQKDPLLESFVLREEEDMIGWLSWAKSEMCRMAIKPFAGQFNPLNLFPGGMLNFGRTTAAEWPLTTLTECGLSWADVIEGIALQLPTPLPWRFGRESVVLHINSSSPGHVAGRWVVNDYGDTTFDIGAKIPVLKSDVIKDRTSEVVHKAIASPKTHLQAMMVRRYVHLVFRYLMNENVVLKRNDPWKTP